MYAIAVDLESVGLFRFDMLMNKLKKKNGQNTLFERLSANTRPPPKKKNALFKKSKLYLESEPVMEQDCVQEWN